MEVIYGQALTSSTSLKAMPHRPTLTAFPKVFTHSPKTHLSSHPGLLFSSHQFAKLKLSPKWNVVFVNILITLTVLLVGMSETYYQIVFCTGGPGVFLGHPYPCPQKTVPEVAGAGTLRLRVRDPCGIPCSLGH